MLKVWNVTSGQLDEYDTDEPTEVIVSVIQLSNGLVVTGSLSGMLELLDFSGLKSYVTLWSAETKPTRISCILEIDHRTILCFHEEPSPTGMVWDVKTGDFLRDINFGDEWLRDIIMLQDGRLCVDFGVGNEGVAIISIESADENEVTVDQSLPIADENELLEGDRCKLLQLEDGRVLTGLRFTKPDNNKNYTLIKVWSNDLSFE